MAFLEPTTVTVVTLKGDNREYIISKFPAIAGREIVAGYPMSAIPKISEYKSNEEIMRKLMCYVGVEINGNTIPLSTEALINNHVPDYETLVKLEIEMMKYNTSFFRDGVISTFSSGIVRKVIASISPTLTPLLLRLLEAAKQLSKN